MFSHVMIGADDITAAKTFYDATLGALGIGPGVLDPKGRCFWMTKTGVFAVTTPLDGEPATGANGGTIGFAAESTDAADAWHAAGLETGGTAVEDPPGIRDNNGRQIYLAYLRDPSGNKICALHQVG